MNGQVRLEGDLRQPHPQARQVGHQPGVVAQPHLQVAPRGFAGLGVLLLQGLQPLGRVRLVPVVFGLPLRQHQLARPAGGEQRAVGPEGLVAPNVIVVVVAVDDRDRRRPGQPAGRGVQVLAGAGREAGVEHQGAVAQVDQPGVADGGAAVGRDGGQDARGQGWQREVARDGQIAERHAHSVAGRFTRYTPNRMITPPTTAVHTTASASSSTATAIVTSGSRYRKAPTWAAGRLPSPSYQKM